jgi:rhomboid protease GluP
MTKSVKQIIIINFIIFAITYLFSLYGLYLNNILALYPIGSDFFRPYQLLTHLFAHHNIEHVFYNMLILFILGQEVEDRLGSRKFWSFYLLSGFFSSGFYCLGVSGGIIGASGAVFATLSASIFINFRKKDIRYILRNLFLSTLIILEFYSAFFAIDNIGHWAHIFGAVFGIGYFFFKRNTNS